MTTGDDWKTVPDEALVSAYWFSDALDDDGYRTLMVELDRRGIDPHKEDK